MRYHFVDRVLDLQPGVSITTSKRFSPDDAYLADHFPCVPVIPGVLLLEAMIHAAAWLTRVSEDFAHSIVVLHEAKNIKYGKLVLPDQDLTIHAEILRQDDRLTRFKTKVTVAGQVVTGGRLILERYNEADSEGGDPMVDAYCRFKMRDRWAALAP